jgi:filamentous hemagglutinin family protein
MVTMLPFSRMCLLTLLALMIPIDAIAQIVPDATLPTNSVVPPGCTTCTIRGGTTRGGNLFHSFRRFSVGDGAIVYFDQAASIRNILVRVTGAERSQINGLIRANGDANLFFLNPNGITFGPNAQLAIGGSFLATTARSFQFADSGEFSATDPQAPPLLAINLPVGLQFGAKPGSIQVQGAGHGLTLDPTALPLLGIDAFAITLTPVLPIRDPDSLGFTIGRAPINAKLPGLRVAAGQTLALVGGDISLEGANLTAAGRVELGGVGANQHVTLTPGTAGWQLGYGMVQRFRDIALAQASAVDVSGSGSGTVQMQGHQIGLSDGSIVFGLTRGDAPGGRIQVRAIESLTLQGSTLDAENPPNRIRSAITTVALPGSTGRGGDIAIAAGRVAVQDNAQGILTLARGSGSGGDIRITAETIDLSLPSTGAAAAGVLASTSIRSSGNAGNIALTTGRLQLTGGAQVNASTLGLGRGGDVLVQARDRIAVVGGTPDGTVFSSIGSNTFLLEYGLNSSPTAPPIAIQEAAGGNVRVETRALSIWDSGQITATTNGSGRGGNVSIQATETIELTGGRRLATPNGVLAAPSLIATSSNAGAALTTGGRLLSSNSPPGAAGNVTVATGRLLLQSGGTIATRTMGSGNGGAVTIRAGEAIEAAGRSADGSLTSRISSTAEFGSTGQAGEIRLFAPQLTLRDQGEVSASTAGTGNAGQVALAVGNLTAATGGQLRVSTAGRGQAGDIRVRARGDLRLTGLNTGLFANTLPTASGAGGNVEVSARSVWLGDRAGIAVGSQGSGRGGDLRLQTSGRITLENQAFLSAETTSNLGGNLTIATPEVLLLRQGSLISAAAGIALEGTPVAMMPFASGAATRGNGGNVTIAAGFVVGQRSENSDIQATAVTGRGGRVALESQGIYGLQLQPQLTPLSDITASSEFGISGSVRLNVSVVDPSRGTLSLPVSLGDASQKIVPACAPVQRGSSFVITGRGGLSPSPTEALNETPVWTGSSVSKPSDAQANSEASQSVQSVNRAIVEASGWVKYPDGRISLVAAGGFLGASGLANDCAFLQRE